jgi:hypothetical protein
MAKIAGNGGNDDKENVIEELLDDGEDWMDLEKKSSIPTHQPSTYLLPPADACWLFKEMFKGNHAQMLALKKTTPFDEAALVLCFP